jgi:hypothetical protein
MTLRLNGSTSGYTEIDAPAVAGSNTLVLPTGAGSANQFLKNGSTAGSLGWSSMVETATGVGIGLASPGQALDVKGFIRSSAGNGTGAGGAAYAFYQFGTSSTASENWHIGTEGDGTFRFYNQELGAGLERMRITSAGNLLVGTTTAGGRLAVASATATVSPIATTSVTGDTVYQAILVSKFDNNTTTSQNFIQFQVNNGGANCGRITANGANTAAFGSTSDIRLKENIADLPPQLQNIVSLRPVEFDYIESEGGGHQIGFIAQEMQAVYPDVVNERGEDDMLMITGWSKTEARLVKAIQEQQAIIKGLEDRLAALEAQ